MDHDLPPSRIEALDFLRGVAVLGILAINVTGFWGPSLATFSPAIPTPDPGGVAWYAIAFVVFEGKMRALFSLLFGASMVLFAQAAERRGADPDLAQLRRLMWLALFGYLHFALLWWGDILFPYALCGLGALALRRVSPPGLTFIALSIYLFSHVTEALFAVPGIVAEQSVLAGRALASDMAEQAGMMARIAASVRSDIAVLDAGFTQAAMLKLSNSALQPLQVTFATFTETLPLMLLGMAMVRSGFFTAWHPRRMAAIATGGIVVGGLPTLFWLQWLAAHRWPPRAMFASLEAIMAVPHLLMALGYAAGLLLLYPLIRQSTLGLALTAAGRCAFTNYIGTSVLMSAIFCGWGLGLGHEMPRVWLPAFVVLGWVAMLAWPGWWLARYGHGPLETLWRRLSLRRR